TAQTPWSASRSAPRGLTTGSGSSQQSSRCPDVAPEVGTFRSRDARAISHRPFLRSLSLSKPSLNARIITARPRAARRGWRFCPTELAPPGRGRRWGRLVSMECHCRFWRQCPAKGEGRKRNRAGGNPLTAAGSRGPLLLPKAEDTGNLDQVQRRCNQPGARVAIFPALTGAQSSRERTL